MIHMVLPIYGSTTSVRLVKILDAL